MIGDVVDDRYRVVREIASGGMGTVYEVAGVPLGNRLALKVIHPHFVHDSALVGRFRSEAKMQAALHHPGIVKVIDVLEYRGRPSFVMEFVEGETLRERLQNGVVDPDLAREVALQLASALSAAHAAGIVHRDLKPDNIFLVTTDLGRPQVKIIDFGIAKAIDGDHTVVGNGTRHSHYLGTYRYSSPEQVHQSSTVDARSDLYSLGVVLWEMLAGMTPYPSATTPYGVQSSVVGEDLPALPADVPPTLRHAVAELIRKAPDERMQTANELVDMLRSTANATPDGATQTAPSRRVVAPTVVGSRPTLDVRPPNGTAGLPPRIVARFVDMLLPMALVLSCVGIVAYPPLALRRGKENGVAFGSKSMKIRVVDHESGQPASDAQLKRRNGFDLALIDGPIALGLWPVISVGTSLAGTVLFWLLAGATITLELFIAAIDPDGRRLADQIAGTRVVVGEPE